MTRGKMTPKPAAFASAFSPNGPARLLVFQERPLSPWSLTALRGRVRALLPSKHLIVNSPDTNDRTAETGWKAIAVTNSDLTVQSLTAYCESLFSNQDHLRICEYPFLVRQIWNNGLGKGVIVDAGGGNSYSTVMLIMMKLSEASIISLDVVNSGLTSKYGVEYRHGDCMATQLEDSSVDLVTCISTLEHVGLGRWGDPLEVDGDILAMKEMFRILRPGGHLILTVPFGEATVVYDLHRIYDEGRINLLCSGYDRIVEEYSLMGQLSTMEETRGRPVVTSFETFYDHQPYPIGAPNPQAGIMLLLRKPFD